MRYISPVTDLRLKLLIFYRQEVAWSINPYTCIKLQVFYGSIERTIGLLWMPCNCYSLWAIKLVRSLHYCISICLGGEDFDDETSHVRKYVVLCTWENNRRHIWGNLPIENWFTRMIKGLSYILCMQLSWHWWICRRYLWIDGGNCSIFAHFVKGSTLACTDMQASYLV
jgi:hypothetical protein